MLRIDRKGHARKSFMKRQNGKIVGIRGTQVKPTVYLARDRGKKGRTPKSKQWFNNKEKQVVIEGYHVDESTAKREAAIRKADAKSNISSANVYHKLLGVSNLQQKTNPKASKIMKRDAEWTKQHLLNKKERAAMTAPARKKWHNMSPVQRAAVMPGG